MAARTCALNELGLGVLGFWGLGFGFKDYDVGPRSRLQVLCLGFGFSRVIMHTQASK